MKEEKKPFFINWDRYLSQERWNEESVIDTEKDRRNPFEVDFGKVIFCPALRRMHDKTQVIPLSSGDCILTRLTHSLHVMNIAESLACNYTRSPEFKALYKDREDKAFEDAQYIRAILKTASLLHDIGNPPFGHFGEDTIKNYFVNFFKPGGHNITEIELDKDEKIDFTQFDGNALGFRIVSKLQYAGRLDGLNLTYGTLGAYLKYPNEGVSEIDTDKRKAYVGKHKHGIFKTERELYNKVVEKCNLRIKGKNIKRHPLAFLVEAADTICYGTMDVEDGLFQHWYGITELLDDLSSIITKLKKEESDVREIIGFDYSDDKIKETDERKVCLELREHFITYLVDLTIRNFISNLEKIDNGTYNNELVYDDPDYVAKALKIFTKRKILSNKNVLKFEITGNSVITGLLDILIKYFFHPSKSYHLRLNGIISESRMAVAMKEDLSEEYPENIVISQDEICAFDVGRLSPYARLRMIVDFVASMTDKYSVELYQTLSGNSL